MGGVLRCSFFLGVLTFVSEATPRAHQPLPRSAESLPGGDGTSLYLPAIGPPPLRFAQGPPPPDLSTHPAAVAPPRPSITEEIAAANTASIKSATPSRSVVPEQDQTIPTEVNPVASGAPVKGPGNKEPQALLPDDTQRETRPEEILPFFQFPGSGGTTIVVPSGATSQEPTRLPVSSAVYRQR
jgi:hypothetical protein